MSFSGVEDASIFPYLAGIVDGEGCFTIGVKKCGNFSPVITVGMAEPEIPNLLKETFGGNVYVSQGKYRKMYRWNLRNFPKMLHAVNSLYPYLRVKKPQADLFKEFIEGREFTAGIKLTEDEKARRASINKKLKILNLVGKEYKAYHSKGEIL